VHYEGCELVLQLTMKKVAKLPACGELVKRLRTVASKLTMSLMGFFGQALTTCIVEKSRLVLWSQSGSLKPCLPYRTVLRLRLGDFVALYDPAFPALQGRLPSP